MVASCNFMLIAMLCAECGALQTHVSPRHVHIRRSLPRLMADEPSAEVADGALIEERSGAGVMPSKFLGVFDMSTGFGSLGGSISVAVMFCFVVELGKLLDPNPASPSMFTEMFGFTSPLVPPGS